MGRGRGRGEKGSGVQREMGTQVSGPQFCGGDRGRGSGVVMMVKTNHRPSLPERDGPAGPSVPPSLSVLLLGPSVSLFALSSRYFLLAQPEERGEDGLAGEGKGSGTERALFAVGREH